MAPYACPECNSGKNLWISVETTAVLVQTDDGKYKTYVINSEQHWFDGNSHIACRSCGWKGCTDDAFKENKVRN